MTYHRCAPALAVAAVLSTFAPSEAATLAVTEPLVAATAVFDPFDTLGGTRVLNQATISIDLETELTTNPISNTGGLDADIDLEMEYSFSWAPDDPAYHAEPTDFGFATVTTNNLITVPAGGLAASTFGHVLPTQSYVENTYDFDEQYGVRLLSAVTGQSVSLVSGGGGLGGFGVSVTHSGTATVEYDYTVVPEPATLALALVAGAVGVCRRSRCLTGGLSSEA